MFANYFNSENKMPVSDNNDEFEIWADCPDVSPNRGWNILAKNRWCNLIPEPYSPAKNDCKPSKQHKKPAPVWKTPEKTYKHSDNGHWKKPSRKWRTPKKVLNLSDDSEDDDFSEGFDSLNNSPRTSTPVRDLNESHPDDLPPFKEMFGNGYRCWKDHLQTTPPKEKLKVRGALFPEEFVSGHFVMKQHEKKQYIENHCMPVLNRCFVNLLINGPSPLICDSDAHADNMNHWKSKCFCLPNCDCTSLNTKERVTLPIGYKYDENHAIVPTTVTVANQKKNPLCIYTN